MSFSIGCTIAKLVPTHKALSVNATSVGHIFKFRTPVVSSTDISSHRVLTFRYKADNDLNIFYGHVFNIRRVFILHRIENCLSKPTLMLL